MSSRRRSRTPTSRSSPRRRARSGRGFSCTRRRSLLTDSATSYRRRCSRSRSCGGCRWGSSPSSFPSGSRGSAFTPGMALLGDPRSSCSRRRCTGGRGGPLGVLAATARLGHVIVLPGASRAGLPEARTSCRSPRSPLPRSSVARAADRLRPLDDPADRHGPRADARLGLLTSERTPPRPRLAGGDGFCSPATALAGAPRRPVRGARGDRKQTVYPGSTAEPRRARGTRPPFGAPHPVDPPGAAR